MTALRREASDILAELEALRAADAPTHGGRVLSYVYDSGFAELDELAGAAARLVQPVNGLDPTTFTSVAVMEAGVVGFARRVFGGDDDVVGSVTSGGTESCLLAVKSARDAWRSARLGTPRVPRLVAPVTVHAAFHKAAHYFGLELDLVPVDPATGVPALADIEERLGDDVALVVVSAPSYPFASLDPVADVAAITASRGIALHVDACIGGFALAFWPDRLPAWDFSVPGVTSLSADLHKYGYAPKGVSVLLTRGRDRQRHQYFATTGWPGYPVVNPTMTGSKPAGPLAAAWALIEALGEPGFADLTARAARATAVLRERIAAIEGPARHRHAGWTAARRRDRRVAAYGAARRPAPLGRCGSCVGVAPPVAARPHSGRRHGAAAHHAPHGDAGDRGGAARPHGGARRGGRCRSRSAAGRGAAVAAGLAAALPGGADALEAAAAGGIDAEGAAALLRAAGLLGGVASGDAPRGGALPTRMAPVLALVEALPGALTERLLVELLARVVEPPRM